MAWMMPAAMVASSMLGGGSESEANNVPTETMTPEQRALLTKLLAELDAGGPLLDQTQATSYTEDLTAKTSGLENLSLSALEQQVMNLVDPKSLGNTAKDTVKGVMNSPFDVNSFNDMFNKSVSDPTTRDFAERVMPELTRRFRGNATFGSDRMNVERQTAEDLGRTLTWQRAKASFDTQEAGKNRQLQAASLTPALEKSGMDTLMAALTAGSVPRGVAQSDLTAKYNEFIRQQSGKKDQQALILAALGLKPFENITTVTPGQPGFIQGMAPGIGSAAASYFLNKKDTKSSDAYSDIPSGAAALWE